MCKTVLLPSKVKKLWYYITTHRLRTYGKAKILSYEESYKYALNDFEKMVFTDDDFAILTNIYKKVTPKKEQVAIYLIAYLEFMW